LQRKKEIIMTLTKLKKLSAKMLKPVALALTIAFAATTLPASAQTANMMRDAQCGERTKIIDTLGKRFKENRFAMGLASNVSLLEFFVSKKGTWTILSTRADGKTCIVAAGKSWVNMPMPLVGEAVALEQ